MHRIDTPTAQIDKFGQGKNGFTNGDPATGRRATDLNSDMWDAVQEEICTAIESAGLTLDKTKHDQLYQAIVQIITSKIPDALLKNNNLSDVVDKALARGNLGLKNASVRDVGTTSGTVAAGDDSRIIGALQKENNLSDLDDKVKSRTNLGLGSIATQNADAVNITGGKASLSTVSTTGNISSGGNLTITGSSTLTGQVEVKGGLISSNGYAIVRAVYENGNQYARIMLTDAGGNKTLAYLEADYGENLVVIIKSRRFILDNNGNLFVPGGVYDNGQHVYSPNNPQPVPKNTAFLGSNGWERDADTGIITQWGSFVSGSTNNETRSFPIPFPNTATVVTGSIGVSGSGTVFLEQNGNGNFNSRTTSAGVGVYWTAKGY